MYTNLKNEIEKDFSKETNYNTIISKIERKKGMASTKIKYILAPTCSLLIGIVGFIGVKNHLQKEELLIDKINVEQAMEEKEKDIININSYASNDIYDIDAKWVDTNLMEEFKFLNNIYIPKFLKETRQGKIYVRDGRDDENYSKFNQYSIIFFDDSEQLGKSVSINFSKEKLLPNCIPSGIDLEEESIINNTKVKLFATELLKIDPAKICGEAYFECNDYKIDIQVYRITEDEFIEIVKSIITEIKENLPVENN